MENPEKNSMESEKYELELCKKAIEVYFQAYGEFLKLGQDETKAIKLNLASIEEDAKTLFRSLNEDDELRLPAPIGAGYSKLIYVIDPVAHKKVFHVYSSIVEDEKFVEWKSFLVKKFKDRGMDLI